MKAVTPVLFLLLVAAPMFAQRTASNVEYHYPSSNARFVSRSATVIYRAGPSIDERSIASPGVVSVTGTSSGVHGGRIVLSDDRRTVMFQPHVAFAPGERVDVVFGEGLLTAGGAPIAPYAFSFTTDRTPASAIAGIRIPGDFEPANHVETSTTDDVVSSSPSSSPGTPSDLPAMTVKTLNNPAPGRIYLSNLIFDSTINTQPYLMILDDAAVPVFRRRKGLFSFDFKRQPNGLLTYFDEEIKQFVVMDSNYNQIGTVNAGHGYETDVHELLMLDNGHMLLMGIAPHQVDLSKTIAGAETAAIVLDVAIQELDAGGNVVFEWRSVDHFAVTDATHANLKGKTVDHVHPNSLALDDEGDIIMSSRHLDEITKISRTTGEIMWRLGGKHNQFTFVDDSLGFSYQHDARWLDDATLTLFDNGNYHKPRFSRAVEYIIDDDLKTATLVWQYRHTPDIYSYAMGNAQRLPNGNTLIGWGANPTVTEVRHNGTVAFEMTLPPGVFSYRAFRLPPATSLVATQLLSPPVDSISIVSSVQLIWERSGGAKSYQVQLALDPSFTTIVSDQTGVAETTLLVDQLLDWTPYFWRVRAAGDDIVGTWSDVWTFSTVGAGVVQRLTAPTKGTEGLQTAPALGWAEFPSAIGYRVQLSRNDLQFNAPIVDTVIQRTYLWTGDVARSTRYYWRVQPVLSDGNANWSEIWDFKTATSTRQLPEWITPTMPRDGAVVPHSAMRFEWNPDISQTLPTAYLLEVSRDQAFSSLVIDSLLLSPRLATTLEGGSYWWRVRGTNANGDQFVSTISTFTVDGASGIVALDHERGFSSTIIPNPASGAATVHATFARATQVSVRLTDVRGTTVLTYPLSSVRSGNHTIALDVANLPNGVYLCVITTPDGTAVEPLVVSR